MNLKRKRKSKLMKKVSKGSISISTCQRLSKNRNDKGVTQKLKRRGNYYITEINWKENKVKFGSYFPIKNKHNSLYIEKTYEKKYK